MTDAQQIVDDWNARYPVGTLVRIMGTKVEGRTSAPAMLAGGTFPAVMVFGMSGENSGAWSLHGVEVVEVDE